MDFTSKKKFFLTIQISTVQYCLKLQNIIYCIVNPKKQELQVLERNITYFMF